MAEEPKKRGEKAMGGKKKGKKKPSRRAKEITFSRMKSGHLKARHKYDQEPMDEEHVVDGSADDHLDQHLAPPETEAMAAPSPSPGGMLGTRGGM